MTSDRREWVRVDLANRLMVFGMIWILGAVLAGLFHQPMIDILGIADTHTSTQAATTGQNYVEFAVNNFWAFVAAIGVVQLVIGAAVERRVGR